MNLKILYDNEAREGLKRGWGFSSLVTMPDEKILFDTGWDGGVLLSNMRKMGEKPEEITLLVLSHSHWDHAGGISHLQIRDREMWIPRSFSNHLKKELTCRFDIHEVEEPGAIRDGIWTTGELGAETKEQSLVIETKKGLLVLVGCSHPGVPQILEAASAFGDPWGIVGGMHEFEEYGALEGLDLIIPTHCTVHKQEILTRFPNASMKGGVGLDLDIH